MSIDEAIERNAVELRRLRFDAANELTRAINGFMQVRPPRGVAPGPRTAAHLERARIRVRAAEQRYVEVSLQASQYVSVGSSSPSSREVTR